MHQIIIIENGSGSFNILLNGFSYRVYRNLNEYEAIKLASEIQQSFGKLHQKSCIENLGKGMNTSD